MTENEKGNAIDWLTDIAQSSAEEWTPFYSFSEMRECAKNALALLKEQEAVAVQPHYIDKYGKCFICGVECGNCGNEISATYKFCPYCGRPVKLGG